MKFDSPLDEARHLAAKVAADHETAAKESLSTGDPGQRRRWIRLVVLVSILVVLIAGAVATVWRPRRSAAIPDGALGTWTTTEPRYADRVFDLTPTTVTFHAPGIAMTYPIRHVTHSPADRLHHLFIEYDDRGSNITLALVYDAAEESLRFAHQTDIVWQRALR